MKTMTYLIALMILALSILYAGCTTNADWGKYRASASNTTSFNNKVISHGELNNDVNQIEKEARYANLSVVNYLHQVNTNKIQRVNAHDLLPDPFLVATPTKIIPRRTAQNKSFDWQGGVSNVPNAKYEVRLQNGQNNELLYLSPTLEEAQQYVKKYMPFHDDLYVYDITGRLLYAPINGLNSTLSKFE